MEESMAAPEHPEAVVEAPHKEPRKRKKRLLGQIADQMDFYFSAANLTKDRFMSSLLDQDPYVDLQTFFKFNKIRSMTTDLDFLRKAISKSSLLELSEDGLRVRRKSDLEVKENELQCTIYVENIPSTADHDWIRQVFGTYGSIDYISVPRYHSSGRPKGFAFVEYKTPEMATKALEAFGVLQRRIPFTIEPSQLQSIKSFDGDPGEQEQAAEENEGKAECDTQSGDKEAENIQSVEDSKEDVASRNVKDLKEEVASVQASKEVEEEEDKGKKRKLEDDDAEEMEKKKKRVSTDENPSGALAQQEESMDASDSKQEDEVDKDEEPPASGKKSKKKRRKRNKKGKEMIESIFLRVMSKEEWKKLRNKYLNTQRENMRQLKMELQERHAQHHHHHHQHHQYQHQPRRRPRGYNTDYGNYQDAEPETNQEPTLQNNTTHKNKDESLKPQFTPNSVIKISFEGPPQDPKKLRETIREGGSGGVAYVDVSATEKDVFVRFLSEEAAATYKKTGCWSRMEVLAGAEEEEYWQRILSCWTQRRNKKNKQSGKHQNNFNSEPRGREKLFQKALKEAQNTKCNSHIVFDD